MSLRFQFICVPLDDLLLCDLAAALCPCRMMVFGVLTLVLSWTSLGADLATAVVSCFTSRPPQPSALAGCFTPNINLCERACNQFPSRLTVVINCFNYTHAALEKCILARAGEEMIIQRCVCADVHISASVQCYYKRTVSLRHTWTSLWKC